MFIELKIQMVIAILLNLFIWLMIFTRNRFMEHILVQLQEKGVTWIFVFAALFFTFNVIWTFWPEHIALFGENVSMQCFFLLILSYSGIIQGFRYMRVRKIEDLGTIGKITHTVDRAVDVGDRRRKQKLMSKKSRGRKYKSINTKKRG